MISKRHLVAGGVLLAVVGAACSDQLSSGPTIAETKARQDSAVFDFSGTANIVMLAQDARGNVTSARTDADIHLSSDGKTDSRATAVNLRPIATINAGSSATGADFQTTTTDSPKLNAPPTFGAPVDTVQQAGKLVLSFKAHAKRVGSSRVNGKLIETFLVQQPGARSDRPAGAFTTIDGRVSQYMDLMYAGNAKAPNSVRVTSVDAASRVTAEMRVEMSNVNMIKRVATMDLPGARKAFGRLMRGVAGLVLPDQLQAMELPYDHPCHAMEFARDTALAAFIYATLNATLDALACDAGAFWMCAASLKSALAATAALLLYVRLGTELNNCLAINPEHCGEFQDNPCGQGTGSTSEVPSGAGSSGDPGSSDPGWSTWGNGDDGIPAGIECDFWSTNEYNYATGVWEVYGHMYCHAI